MTSIMFGTLNTIGVPADEKVVRSTSAPVILDAPPAMADDMPEPQELETDHNPDLGMVNRQVASKWVEGQQFVPSWIPLSDGNDSHNSIIDQQVASSGTAAHRETQGQWGHGTASYAIGIEPVGDLVDGHKMGNTYFVRTDRHIQETMTPSMLPSTGIDRSVVGRVDAAGKVNARKAAQAGMYNAFWNGGN